MAKKGAMGFLAEMQRQSQIAARDRERQANAANRARASAQRQAETAFRQAQAAALRAQKSSIAEQKAAEKEAQRLHLEARQAEVEARNAALLSSCSDIDSILASTLGVDDFVDLEELRVVAEHPAFESEHARPSLPPPALVAPPEPIYVIPGVEPGKIGGIFGGRKKFAELEEHARAAHAAVHAAWQHQMSQLPGLQQQLQAQHEQAEQQRLTNLAAARSLYDVECAHREAEALQKNEHLDNLIQGLAYSVEEAIQEYVSIVLSNSVYPEAFPVEHDFEFNSALRELTLTVLVPAPDSVPRVKEFKYVRAKDEITETALPQKEIKDRYKNAVAQVGVRTLHEIFEADRTGRIGTIALTIATETIDAGTGLMKRTPLVAVAAERSHFMSFDLSNIVPQATLETLGAQISKSPHDLVAIDTSKGVRAR